jgi:hypothetical protein
MHKAATTIPFLECNFEIFVFLLFILCQICLINIYLYIIYIFGLKYVNRSISYNLNTKLDKLYIMILTIYFYTLKIQFNII